MSMPNLAEYADDLLGGEDSLLKSMREEAAHEGMPAINIPPDVVRLLTLLIRQARMSRILEIGTLFGYSATVMARALPDDGRLTSLEMNPSHVAAARRNLERAGMRDKVDIMEGPALESLARLHQERFELVFIDANKDSYPSYLEWALKLTRPGSLIIADNVWRDGAVAAPTPDDPGTTGLSQFNQALAHTPSLLSTFIPARDCSDAVSVSVVL